MLFGKGMKTLGATLRHEDKLCVLLNCGPYKLYRLLEDPATDRLTHPTAMNRRLSRYEWPKTTDKQ